MIQRSVLRAALTAGLVGAIVSAGGCGRQGSPARVRTEQGRTYDHGGIVRGDQSARRLALVFTGGEYGEGTEHILDVLDRRGVKASFFVTGAYIRAGEYAAGLRRMMSQGHYLGPHSDSHPLYCAWENRKHTLVTEDFFRSDLTRNIEDLRRLGAMTAGKRVFFIPPYEWFNEDQVRWSGRMGVVLFNFTPGSGSNRDWAPEGHPAFVPSRTIIDDVLACERRDPDGLNGYLLLLHLGSHRNDKPYLLLDELLAELQSRGYAFARVDELLR